MKKSFAIIVAFATLTLFACNNNSGEKHEHNPDGSHPATEGTHTHDDGSVHQDHADTTVNQEQFKVGEDTAAHGHDHSDPNHKH